MGKIDELINRLAHTKIQTVPLWSVTAWDKKFNAVDKAMQKKIVRYKYLLAKDLEKLVVPNGTIRILYTTKDVAYTTEKLASGYISEGEVVAIPWGGNPTVKYYNGKFVTGDNRIVTALDKTTLDNKYLFYWMDGETKTLASFYRGAGIKHPSMVSVLTMEIPLPPLAEQKEIVEILDTFTGMIDNLQKELEQRQKQFEHYRDQLLTFKEDECKYSKLADVCEVINGRAYKQSELLSDGKYRVLRVGNFFSNDSWYYSNLELDDKNYCQKGDLLYAWSASFGPRIWKEEKVVFHYHIWKMACSDGLDRVFFYYWLQSHDMERQVSSGKHGATMAHLTKKLMESLMIPVPSLEKQQEIVDKLDTFEALISNIKQEIELRQKQYEYYREKLLTFE